MKMNPIPLGIYLHYKGNQYKVVGFAKHSETLEDMVIYKALYGERGMWVRPLSMWGNPIEINGKTVKRFEYINEKENLSGELIKNLDKIHTTKLGAERIRKNIDLNIGDIAEWCRQKVLSADEIYRQGKNWYVNNNNCVITINAHSYTIITAHK